ncbi:hypothetical protein [Massilia soli]|uniref:Uncharacterized protein n=1 Tax=Massilia soli TaxID=2792854 RepID=A0ABS7SKZ7_9BURK|nr:hypothetical protein [Massilia soli]MBZ2205815.1 hypothetical protein [Massilia soli]
MEYEAKQPVNLPIVDYLRLEFHLMETRPNIRPDAFVADLVQRWLMIDTERLALRKNGRPMRGFQWKNLFLPDGTKLRTTYCDATEFAQVMGDRIVSDNGARLTPSQFANLYAKGRNAWRFVWLRFPGDENWRRAADCRARAESQRQQTCEEP